MTTIDPAEAHDWYAIVTFGAALQPSPEPGPFRGRKLAEEAWDDFVEQQGADAGTYLAAQSARIVGPFCSRADADRADISDYPRYICTHDC